MPCDTRRLPNQSISQRKEEIKTAVDKLGRALAAGKVKPVIDKATGAIAFAGSELGQARVTDGCALRLLMSTGSALARQAIERAELLAGRKVDKMSVAHGVHSHDGGKTWHHGH